MKNKKKVMSLISEKYSDPNGKKFILHLISAFIVGKANRVCSSDLSRLGKNECCITRKLIVPNDVNIPSDEGDSSYGYYSNTSDRIISDEALEALKRFVEERLSKGDDVITKVSKYIGGSSVKKGPQSKNDKPKNKEVRKSNSKYIDLEAIPPRKE